ncbi:hypothetical protein GCM10027515_03680 [Schumannella luteola]|uniref:Uncharacterized protein YjbJ (UPF0337 family) n=1 Tax=Schumannella luteola TaxID=472059 RepID=A0A852YFH0_9MICO|nr:CsbD family protein [Schumannella luteola]NYG98497.1 uncharacterized protein YjbJ (UPF0337 family) [Schumannella luteola]TPX01278.1 CsbD family protein [Schumannella luteola]
MALDDDIKNTAQKLTGKGKEVIGAATGNEKLETEGKADQVSATAKEKVADVKDVASDLKDKLTGGGSGR